MSRLSRFDRAMVLILVPLWAAWFAVAFHSQVRGGGFPMVVVSLEGAEHYPELTGEVSQNYPPDWLAQAGLAAGDRLVRVGDADLRGVGLLGFWARSIDESEGRLLVPLVFERRGELREASLALIPVTIWRPLLIASFALAVSALFLLLRGRSTPTVRSYFYFAMCWAFTTIASFGSATEFYVTCVVLPGANLVFFPLAFHFVFRFPDDRPPRSHWHRFWPWLFSVAVGFFSFGQLMGHLRAGEVGFTVTFAVAAVVMLAAATWKYRGADPLARRQMKWVLLGIYCTLGPLAIAGATSNLDPRLHGLWLASFAVLPLLPLSLVVSVLRFNLFDVDRVLSAAASYNILLVLLGAGALVVVPRIAETASGA